MLGYLENYFTLIMMSCVMIFILLSQPRERRRDDIIMVGLYLGLLATSLSEYLDSQLALGDTTTVARYVFAVTAYIMRPILIACMVVIIDTKFTSYFWFWLPLIINAAIYLVSPFTGLAFTFGSDNDFSRGPLGYTMFAVGAIYAFMLVFSLYAKFDKASLAEAVLLVVLAGVGALAAVVDVVGGDITESGASPKFLPTLSMIFCLYYLFLRIQYNREKELEQELELEKNRVELSEKQSELMLSQIQPHFIYNTLTSVRYLIPSDPEKAEDTLDKFTRYLRTNMDSLGKKAPITFEDELEHVETYIEIEKTRFPSIELELDIEDEIFDLPALTLQPLVENAVKHGIRNVENGRIVLKTRYEDDKHVITVSDNGVGFDLSDYKPGIGIKNVKKRLKLMVNGTMDVKSAPGKGTVVTVVIPEEGENEDISG